MATTTIRVRLLYSCESYCSNSAASIPKGGRRVLIPAPAVIKNVSLLLVRQGTTIGIYANTNYDGFVYFTDVPPGSYYVYECFGYKESAESMVSMNYAVDLGMFTPKDPTVEFLRMQSNPALTLYDATRIVSLISNSYRITVNSDVDPNSVVKFFMLDAPAINIPLELDGYQVSGENLIKKLGGGTCGENPINTANNYSPASAPFPGDIIGFGYMKCTDNKPNDGYYSVININAQHTFTADWFDMADHTTGDQTSNFVIINGDFPNKYFFIETVSGLQHNTYYVFSMWVMNIQRQLANSKLPAFKVMIKDENGKEYFSKNLSDNLIQTVIPTWKQVGTIFNTGEHDTLTVNFISMGPAGSGNDFAIDDVSLKKLSMAPEPEFIKTADRTVIWEDEAITYTITFTNPGPVEVTNITIIDILPKHPEIMVDYIIEVNVNGVSNILSSSRLESGVFVQRLPAHASIIITYSVGIRKQEYSLLNSYIDNYASSTYQYVLNEAQGEIVCQKYTDTVTTFVRYPHFSFEKTSPTMVISPQRPAKYFYAGVNSGNESFSHLYYEDLLSSYVEYMENSAVVHIDDERILCKERIEPYREGEVLPQGVSVYYDKERKKIFFYINWEVPVLAAVVLEFYVQLTADYQTLLEIDRIPNTVTVGYDYTSTEWQTWPVVLKDNTRTQSYDLFLQYAYITTEKSVSGTCDLDYRIRIYNEGNRPAVLKTIEDLLPEEFIPAYLERTEDTGITKQVIAPERGNVTSVSFSEIEWDPQIPNSLSIFSITVPPRSDVERGIKGMVEIHVKGRVECEEE